MWDCRLRESDACRPPRIKWNELLARVPGYFLKKSREQKGEKLGQVALEELHAMSPRPGEASTRFTAWLRKIHHEAPPAISVSA
mmetsp:Transcript_60493/g.141691  ORF Transcript_60493/g.141691 Transcript_60493/m.141691 type:complete len:84 (+) Transcript_60493:282-533(+)